MAVIGSDQWPRASLRAELIERGYDAVGYVTLEDALVALALPRAPRPHLFILDLHEQPLDERRLGALFRHGVPVVAIAGAAEAADEGRAPHPWAALLRRPLTIGTIADRAEAALRV